MKKFRIYIIVLGAFCALLSCTYDFPEVNDSGKQYLGEINNSNIIVIGDDFMAGVMDGALYNQGQQNSLGAIIYSQVKFSNDTPLIQPNIDSKNGYNLFVQNANNIKGRWVYQYKTPYVENPELVLTPGEMVKSFEGNRNQLNDFSVPLLKASQIRSEKLNENQFINRITASDSKKYVELIKEQNPSIVFCWIGMNDFLDFALGGAETEEELTSENKFYTEFEFLISEIAKESDCEIMIANLISFTDLPFFYLKQYNFLKLDNTAKAKAQQRYSAFNAAVSAHNAGRPADEQRPYVSFYDNGVTLYPQPLVVEDENLPDAYYPDGTPLEKFRQLKEGDLALFSITDKMVADGYGSTIPLSGDFYISEEEKDLLNDLINSFNNIINEISAKYSSQTFVVDVKSEIHLIAESSKVDAWNVPKTDTLFYEKGVPVKADLGLYSIFSLDAVHFNQRGNAFVANIFLQSVNTNFTASVPLTNINDFVGNVYVFDY